MRIVTWSGSLSTSSSNRALLEAMVALAPPELELIAYRGVAELPAFNPDLDYEGAVPPPPVATLRALMASAAGFVISSPEYAHGVPGAFKNALDWLVSSGELVGKPVLLLNAAPGGGEHARAALLEILRTVSAEVLPASLLEPFLPRKLKPGAPLEGAAADAVRGALAALAAALPAW